MGTQQGSWRRFCIWLLLVMGMVGGGAGESLELGRIQCQNALCEGLVLCSGLELGRWAECCTTLSPIPRSIKSELMGVGPPESLSLYVF